MSATNNIGPFIRIVYAGQDGFRELDLDITKFKMRRAKTFDRNRYWTERWAIIRGGLANAMRLGERAIILRYDVPGDIHHIDNHTSLFLLAPGKTDPVLMACDDYRIAANEWNVKTMVADQRLYEDDKKALKMFPALCGANRAQRLTREQPPRLSISSSPSRCVRIS
jgi:hypothetical protein